MGGVPVLHSSSMGTHHGGMLLLVAALISRVASLEGCGEGYTCVAWPYGCAPTSNTSHMVCCSDGQQSEAGINKYCSDRNRSLVPFCPAGGATGRGCIRMTPSARSSLAAGIRVQPLSDQTKAIVNDYCVSPPFFEACALACNGLETDFACLMKCCYSSATSLSAETVERAPSAWAQFIVNVRPIDWEHCSATNQSMNGTTARLAPGPVPSSPSGSASHTVHVGTCDSGELSWELGTDPIKGKPALSVTFRSGLILDASPPQCYVPVVDRPPPGSAPLPKCEVIDSREGYHLTQYSFYLFNYSQWVQ